jgi:hypothetical protein
LNQATRRRRGPLRRVLNRLVEQALRLERRHHARAVLPVPFDGLEERVLPDHASGREHRASFRKIILHAAAGRQKISASPRAHDTSLVLALVAALLGIRILRLPQLWVVKRDGSSPERALGEVAPHKPELPLGTPLDDVLWAQDVEGLWRALDAGANVNELTLCGSLLKRAIQARGRQDRAARSAEAAARAASAV